MSGYPWDNLGLEGPTDTRTIKRAYAARLKKCRPEDDSEGFAILRRAYETALSWSDDAPAAPQEIIDRDDMETCEDRGEGENAESTALPSFDPQAKAEAILAHGDPASLSAMLHADESLWNFTHKQMVSATLARWTVEDPLGLGLERLRVLAAFFHWDDVAEQSRLQNWMVDVAKLRLCLSAFDLQRDLDGSAKLRKPYGAVRRLRRWGTGPLAWIYALFWIRPLLANRDLELVPSPVRELVIDRRILDFWARMQGGLNLHRMALQTVRVMLIAEIVSGFYYLTSGPPHLPLIWMINGLALGGVIFGYLYRLLVLWLKTPHTEPLPLAAGTVFQQWRLDVVLAAATLACVAVFPADASAALFYAAIFCGWLAVRHVLSEDTPAVIRIAVLSIGLVPSTFSNGSGGPSLASRTLQAKDYDLAAWLTVLLIFTAFAITRRAPGIVIGRVPPVAVLCGLIWTAALTRLATM